ncbi:MAG TPA: hypothetical protein K8W23_00445 [Sellimonas intestinalis]|nr:hypothetical protein [Sellimonas intestinalis]
MKWLDTFCEGFKDLLGTDNKQALPTASPQKESAIDSKQEKTAPAQVSWWQKKNAEYYRDRYPTYVWWIFPNMWDFEQSFGKTLDRFFYSHAGWRMLISFPEIAVSFVAVNVYGLRPEWNRRDIDLKRILLSELRRAFVEHASSKGYNLSGIINCVIADIWLVGDVLVMEIPQSEFVFRYPHLARVLATEEYWKLRRGLDQKTRF